MIIVPLVSKIDNIEKIEKLYEYGKNIHNLSDEKINELSKYNKEIYKDIKLNNNKILIIMSDSLCLSKEGESLKKIYKNMDVDVLCEGELRNDKENS